MTVPQSSNSESSTEKSDKLEPAKETTSGKDEWDKNMKLIRKDFAVMKWMLSVMIVLVMIMVYQCYWLDKCPK